MHHSLRRMRLAGAGLILAAALGVTPAFAADDQPAKAEAAQPAPDTVVATVDGQPITQAEIATAAESLDPQFSRLPPEQRRAAALSALIELKVVSDQAAREKLDQNEDFKQRMAFLRERALHSEYIQKRIADTITDDQVRARYDKEIAATPPANEIHARHILVKTREEAEAIIKQLDGGADFEKLASEHTTDPSGKTSGGDLGYFSAGQMVPEFEKAAFALDVGKYTEEPVQTQFGWHIIKVEDKRAKQPPAFDAVKDQIRQVMMTEKYVAEVGKLRGAAEVDIKDAALKAQVESLDKPASSDKQEKTAPEEDKE